MLLFYYFCREICRQLHVLQPWNSVFIFCLYFFISLIVLVRSFCFILFVSSGFGVSERLTYRTISLIHKCWTKIVRYSTCCVFCSSKNVNCCVSLLYFVDIMATAGYQYTNTHFMITLVHPKLKKWKKQTRICKRQSPITTVRMFHENNSKQQLVVQESTQENITKRHLWNRWYCKL